MNQPDPELLAERHRKLDALGPCPPWWRLFVRRRWRRAYAVIMAVDVSQAAAFYRRLYPLSMVEEMAKRQSATMKFLTKAPKRTP